MIDPCHCHHGTLGHCGDDGAMEEETDCSNTSVGWDVTAGTPIPMSSPPCATGGGGGRSRKAHPVGCRPCAAGAGAGAGRRTGIRPGIGGDVKNRTLRGTPSWPRRRMASRCHFGHSGHDGTMAVVVVVVVVVPWSSWRSDDDHGPVGVSRVFP